MLRPGTSVSERKSVIVPRTEKSTSSGSTLRLSGRVSAVSITARPSPISTERPAFSRKRKGGWSSSDRAAVTPLSLLSEIRACAGFSVTSGTSKTERVTRIGPPAGGVTCPSSSTIR